MSSKKLGASFFQNVRGSGLSFRASAQPRKAAPQSETKHGTEPHRRDEVPREQPVRASTRDGFEHRILRTTIAHTTRGNAGRCDTEMSESGLSATAIPETASFETAISETAGSATAMTMRRASGAHSNVMRLSRAKLSKLSVEQRFWAIENLSNDLIVWNRKERRILSLLSDGLSPRDQQRLSALLIRGNSGANPISDILERRMGGWLLDIGRQQAAYRVHLDRSYWTFTQDIDVAERREALAFHLTVGDAGAHLDYLMALVADCPAPDRLPLLQAMLDDQTLQPWLAIVDANTRARVVPVLRALIPSLATAADVSDAIALIGLKNATDTSELAAFFSTLISQRGAAFAEEVASRSVRSVLFAPWTSLIDWVPDDIDQLEPIALDTSRRAALFADHRARFSPFIAALPVGATANSLNGSFAATHTDAYVAAEYAQQLRAYYTQSQHTASATYEHLLAEGTSVDQTAISDLQVIAAERITEAEVRAFLTARSQDGWFESEQLAALDYLLDVDSQQYPLQFADRAAYKAMFDAAIVPAINDRLFDDISSLQRPIDRQAVERLVQKYAWSDANDGAFSTPERLALAHAQRQGWFTPQANTLVAALASGKTPTELGLLNTNLSLIDRQKAIETYLKQPELSPVQQGHLWRLVRDTEGADRVALVAWLAQQGFIATALSRVEDQEGDAEVKNFLLGSLYQLNNEGVMASGIAATQPTRSELATFLNNAVLAQGAAFTLRMLSRDELKPLNSGALSVVAWQAPADLPLLERFAKDAAYRSAAFGADLAAKSEFVEQLQDPSLRAHFNQVYTATHQTSYVQTAFNSAVDAFYSKQIPAAVAWRNLLRDSSVTVDSTFASWISAQTAGSSIITATELRDEVSRRLISQRLPLPAQLALAEALATQSGRDLFGDDFRAMEYAMSLSPAGFEKVDGTGPYIVWSKENHTSSNGAVVSVDLPGAPRMDGGDFVSDRVEISGNQPMSTAEGQQPYSGSTTGATRDAFDRVNVMWGIETVLEQLEAAGIEIDDILGRMGKVKVKANGVSDVNAWYDTRDYSLTFGTGSGKWHLASDGDVVVHELGHLILDQIAGLGLSGEAGGIHEGFGDILSAMVFNDPELGEDIRKVDSGESHIRTANNRKKLSEVGSEVHDRGEVYAGFGWSIKGQLEALGVPNSTTRTLMIRALVKHAYLYETDRPSAKDFAQNMLDALNDELQTVLTAEKLSAFVASYNTEAKFRGMTTTTLAPSTPVQGVHVGEGDAQREEMEQAARDALPAAVRGKVQLQQVQDESFRSVRRVTYQAVVKRKADGKLIPIYGAKVTIIAKDGVVQKTNAPSTVSLPASFSDGLVLHSKISTLVAGPVKALFTEKSTGNQKLNDHVLKNFATIFDAKNMQVDEVVYEGAVMTRLRTSAGEILIDPRTNSAVLVSSARF